MKARTAFSGVRYVGMFALFSTWHPFLDGAATHPGGEDRFMALAGHLGDGLGGSGRIGHGLGSQDHQGRINFLVFQHDLQRPGVAIGRGVAEHVDRVMMRPEGWQYLVEPLDGLLGKLGQLAGAFDHVRPSSSLPARRHW